MAGERKGKACEALVQMALNQGLKARRLPGVVNWNMPIESLSVEPDIWIADAKGNPTHLCLVTHSGSHSSSHKKFWRNVGEIAEAKVMPGPDLVPRVGTIIFDTRVKENLRVLEASLVDFYHEVGEEEYGPCLIKIADAIAKSKIETTGFIEFIQTRLDKNADDRAHFARFSSDLINLVIPPHAISINDLWRAARNRIETRDFVRVPDARTTSVRRGVGKLLLSASPNDVVKNANRTVATAEEHLVHLKLYQRTIAGYRLIDPDITQAISLLGSSTTCQLVDRAHRLSALTSLVEPLRVNAQASPLFHSYIISHWSEFLAPESLYRHLLLTHSKRGEAIGANKKMYVRPGWLFQLLIAIVKAASGRRQGYGYSVLINELASLADPLLKQLARAASNAAIDKPHSLRSPRTVEYGLRDWFFGDDRTNFDIRPFELFALCSVLSSRLVDVPVAKLAQITSEAQEFEAQDLVENVILQFNQFQPLKWLIEQHLSEHGLEHSDISYWPTPMYDHAVATGSRLNVRSSSTAVLHCKSTLIRWISVTDEGRDHKRKEFAGRAAVMPITWSKGDAVYKSRGNVTRMLLLVDGTFRATDLQLLHDLGWDGIFYPNELEDMIRSIR